jgi:hypothetical protein
MNYNRLHCLKKSYQTLKERIRRKYKFKELVKIHNKIQ